MRKCPNCGHRKWFEWFGSDIFKCIVCGKEGCSECIAPNFHFLLTLIKTDYMRGRRVYACSKECAQKFQQLVFDSIPLSETVGTDESYVYNRKRSRRLFDDACFNVLLKLNPEVVKDTMTKKLRAIIMMKDEHKGHSSSLRSNYLRQICFTVADNLEAVGRFSDAARIYETLKMYDKARQLREKEKQIVVKRTEISVDLNRLLEQVRDGGIVVVYRCPHCNAPLRIGKDTNVESLTVCEHCGSEIEAVDVADFLKTALS